MLNRNETPEFLTKRAAARRLGVGLRQIQRAIREGNLSLYDIGGWPRVRWSDVLAWIESTRRTDGDPASEHHQARESGQ